MANDRRARWYLRLMDPSNGWIYTESTYAHARAFHEMLDDLVAPFSPDEVDLVAAPDAMGFILGAAMAARLGKGFLPLRKPGRLYMACDSVQYKHHTGRTETLEIPKYVIEQKNRVLLVDQWIETGATIRAAIELIERQGGIVAGISTICIEDNLEGQNLRREYKCSTAVLPGTELQSLAKYASTPPAMTRAAAATGM
jgi:adenine phosphoribosyltransferase